MKPAAVRPVRASGDRFGMHRVLAPEGALPQPAERVDNDFRALYSGELLVAVETLNIDAASFRQMEDACRDDPGSGRDVGERIRATVSVRGKQHNPVTGSGGMLLGRVIQVAPDHPDVAELNVGDRIASLVSLSLTPLRVDTILAIRPESAQVDIEGEAVLFASGPYAVMPSDIPERLALAVLDVAGAAPQVARLVAPESSVCVLGAGGKSGVLCCVEARRAAGPGGVVIGVESYDAYAEDLRALGICDHVIVADATDPVSVRREVERATGGEVDTSFSCVNVPDAELSAILPVRDGGTAYFFSMTTSFTKAALGAEGVGKDVTLVIGNGFARGHAEHSLEMLRVFPKVRALFERRYC